MITCVHINFTVDASFLVFPLALMKIYEGETSLLQQKLFGRKRGKRSFLLDVPHTHT